MGQMDFLRNPTDEEEWANKMTTLFSDFENTRHMGVTGKAKLVADFSNEHIVKAMENLYECVLTRKTQNQTRAAHETD